MTVDAPRVDQAVQKLGEERVIGIKVGQYVPPGRVTPALRCDHHHPGFISLRADPGADDELIGLSRKAMNQHDGRQRRHGIIGHPNDRTAGDPTDRDLNRPVLRRTHVGCRRAGTQSHPRRPSCLLRQLGRTTADT